MKQILVTVIAVAFSVSVMAQESSKKNEVKVFYGDTFGFQIANGIGNGLIDALSGQQRDSKTFGMYGVGYRYHFNRLSVGADFGYIGNRDNVKLKKGNATADYRTNDVYALVLPSANFSYFKKGIVELYGGASVGAMLQFSSSKGLTTAGKDFIAKTKVSDKSAIFAFQVTPIGIRLGNERIGGFVEAGYGMKGIVNAGLSLKF